MREYTLQELAELTGAELVGNPHHRIQGVENLDSASPEEASFLDNSRYEKQLAGSRAGVVCIHSTATLLPGRNFLLSRHPSLTFQKILELFRQPALSGFKGIHPSAVIHPTAELGEGVSCGPHVVIDRDVVIGAGTVLEAGVTIGAESRLGAHCHLYPRAVVREGCQLGDRVVLQPGAVIGSCGFGYFTDEKGKHRSLKQLGGVILEDDVEIGANTTIDRARFKMTTVKKGSKIDNLVQIAHQVVIGEDNMIVSQVGIAGSTTTGRHVVMGGQVGVAGHLTIADGVMLAARAAVSKSLTTGGPYSGIPAMPLKEFNLHFAQVRSMGALIKRVKALEAKIEDLEKGLSSPKTPLD